MDIKAELLQYNVSRETFEKLATFVELLKEWNAKINLVSKNSLDEVWTRHVLDSAQLIKYIPEKTKYLLDIGSGAGFPAIVLAIIMQEKNPSAKWVLAESITKKTVYLNDVCTKLELTNVHIENNRVENLILNNIDIVTARAVASLETLCSYVYGLKCRDVKCLFIKGKTYGDELQAAYQKWRFGHKVYQNLYSEDGVILEIDNIRKVR